MIARLRDSRVTVSNAADFGRVAVFYGGFSSEREISLDSGSAVLEALKLRGVDAVAWDPSKQGMQEFAGAGFDCVWNALHGPGGEDGALQGALHWLDTPFTGSGVMASALAMDKVRSKHLFRFADIATPEYQVMVKPGDAVAAAEEFGFPLVLKPDGQGSSVGMTKVLEAADLAAAAKLALSFSGVALAERCIVGEETTVAILQGQPLPSIRIETPRVFYDYRAKYESDSTEYICPGSDDPAMEQKFHDLAIAAFEVLGCSGWGRIDFMTGDDGQPQVLEVNTVPGMTSHSLVPMAADAAGIDFAELCWRILETSIADESAMRPAEVAVNGA